jgi:hypothetical protein
LSVSLLLASVKEAYKTWPGLKKISLVDLSAQFINRNGATGEVQHKIGICVKVSTIRRRTRDNSKFELPLLPSFDKTVIPTIVKNVFPLLVH